MPAVIRQEDGSRDACVRVFNDMDIDSNGTINLDKFTRYLHSVSTADVAESISRGRVASSDVDAEGSEEWLGSGHFSSRDANVPYNDDGQNTADYNVSHSVRSSSPNRKIDSPTRNIHACQPVVESSFSRVTDENRLLNQGVSNRHTRNPEPSDNRGDYSTSRRVSENKSRFTISQEDVDLYFEESDNRQMINTGKHGNSLPERIPQQGSNSLNRIVSERSSALAGKSSVRDQTFLEDGKKHDGPTHRHAVDASNTRNHSPEPRRDLESKGRATAPPKQVSQYLEESDCHQVDNTGSRRHHSPERTPEQGIDSVRSQTVRSGLNQLSGDALYLVDGSIDDVHGTWEENETSTVLVPSAERTSRSYPTNMMSESNQQSSPIASTRRGDKSQNGISSYPDSSGYRQDQSPGRASNKPIDDSTLVELKNELRELESQLAQSHKEAMESRGKIRILEGQAAEMNNAFRSFRERSALELGEQEDRVEALTRQLNDEKRLFHEENAGLIAECNDLKVVRLFICGAAFIWFS